MADKKKKRSRYAVPCKETKSGEIFFVSFHTREEKEALRLASCVQGPQGRKALVVINEDGEIFQID